MNDKKINIAIIGAGENSAPIIRALAGVKSFNILGVADENKNMPGIVLAKELGINTESNTAELIKNENLDLVIETSGSSSFIEALKKMVSEKTIVMDEPSVRFMLELSKETDRLLKLETTAKVTQKYLKMMEEINEKLDGKNLELSILNDLSKTFSSALDSRNVASFIFTFLKKKINFYIYAVLLIEEGRKELMLISSEAIPTEVKEEVRLIMSNRYSQFIKSDINPDEILVTAEKMDIAAQSGDKKEPSAGNFFTIPLEGSDKTFGLLGLVFYEGGNFTPSDEDFLKIIAGQLALFLENEKIRQLILGERNTFEAVLRSMTNAVLVIDDKDNIVLVNPLAETFLGVKTENILYKNINEIIPQDEVKLMFLSMIKQKGAFLTKEIDIINQIDGIGRSVKANMSIIRGYLGNTKGAVLVLNDITKEKEMDRLKTDFIAITSHELRTPLASIKEAVSLVLDGTVGEIGEQQKNFLRIAKRNIDRLANLVNNLLDLSKMESGKMEIKRLPCDIKALAQEVVATFNPLAKNKNINFETKFDKGLPQIKIDKEKILQVFANLISNAVKFTPDGGAITIEIGFYGSDKDYVQATVQDTGNGIDQKEIWKLFQKFHQIDSSTTRNAGGTGLGLAVSKEIIDMHGGRIWVESEINKGSRFCFTIPVEYSAEKLGRKTILVIDDEPDLCSTIKKRLEVYNYTVITALNGKDGLEKIKEHKPSLIILDIMMPEMDGFEVCRIIKRDVQMSGVPVIMLTALGYEDDAKRAFAMGAEGYLVKPFEEESLLFTIKQFLDKK